jgi:hypothetical protein
MTVDMFIYFYFSLIGVNDGFVLGKGEACESYEEEMLEVKVSFKIQFIYVTGCWLLVARNQREATSN